MIKIKTYCVLHNISTQQTAELYFGTQTAE